MTEPSAWTPISNMSFTSLTAMAMLAALITIGLSLGLQIYLGRERRARFRELVLTPNILMTRYPLLFVGRTRSLFRMSGDFLELPVYLQEHGYKVEEIEMVDDRQSFATLLRVLSTCPEPVHLIVSEAFSEIAYDLAIEGHEKLSTLTLLSKISHSTSHPATLLKPPRRPIFEKPELRPSSLATNFGTEEIALQHMVSLAEFDLR